MQSIRNGKDGGNGYICVGGASYASSYMAVANDVKFYSIRLYSRAIDSGEVASNYIVDKVRFGLP